MSTFIEAKVKYDKIKENGALKKVTDSYIVDALSFTEAEAKVTELVSPFISGDFTVSAVTKSNISEIFHTESGDYWYKVKVNYITIDEKTSTEKMTSVYYLVQAADFQGAVDNFMDAMKGTMADFIISSVAETKILDVFDAN